MRKKVSLGVRMVGGVAVMTPLSHSFGQSEWEPPARDMAKSQKTMVENYPEIKSLPFDKQKHFFVSAKLLRLTDMGKTWYGSALIGAEQVRIRGVKKEISDIHQVAAEEIASGHQAKISKAKFDIICQIDDLILQEGLENQALTDHLEGRLVSFKPHQVAGGDRHYSSDYLTFYGKVMLEWYGGERAWFKQALADKGLTKEEIGKHPIIEAFDTLMELSRKEDRLVYSRGLDQGDLLANLGGILKGLAERGEEERNASFINALEKKRGEASGMSAAEFYQQVLGGDEFVKAIAELPAGIADGSISTHCFAVRYVVSSNLPQQAHTVLAADNVRIEYHPLKDDPWAGVISTVVTVPPIEAKQLAENLFDLRADNPAKPSGREKALENMYKATRDVYQQVVDRSGLLRPQLLYASNNKKPE